MGRATMPITRRLAAVVLHGTAVWTMYWGFFVGLDSTGFDDWVQSQKGGHMQFLTIQGLALAAATLSLGLLHELVPSIPLIKQVKRTLSLISLPLAFTISIIYWSLVLFAPSLIMPQPSEGLEGAPSAAAPPPFRLDTSVDLSLHAVPAISLLLDFLVFERKFSPRAMKHHAPVITFLMGLWYGSWVEYCAKHNDGVFPYPFLTFSPLPGRIGIYLGATGLTLSVLWVLNPLHTQRQGPIHARKRT
ncbi:hypothetical protein PENSPDRAFT_34963 [Peniophora sp. CONT]|nr:hypothetical protein PENSPDRAFT_34963 [Peniophora sp. CONT]